MDCGFQTPRAAVKYPETLCWQEKTRAFFATKACAFFTNSGMPDLLRNAGFLSFNQRGKPKSGIRNREGCWSFPGPY
jgi:hypothetical protein